MKSITRQIVCPTRLSCTSEDEWKWFIAIWFILLKEANIGKRLEYGDGSTVTIYIQNAIIHNITYSVHDGSLMSRRTLLPVFLVAPWVCCPLLCCWSTAYIVPLLEGQALSPPPPPPTPGWPHFPQGPGIYPLPRQLQIVSGKINCESASSIGWKQ